MSDRLCARHCRLPRRHAATCAPHSDETEPSGVKCTCACHNAATRCSDRQECLLQHDPDCRGCQPAPAEHGDLCWRCHRRLELLLIDMPAVYAWVMVHLPAGSRPAPRIRAQIRRTKGEPPLPLDADVLDMGEQILQVVYGWISLLVADTSLAGPRGRRTVASGANYLLTHITAVENQPWIADAWEELAFTSSQSHALAPWRAEMTRCKGIPCPECQDTALAIFGGQDDVQCLSCRALIPQERYNLWTRMLANEAASA